MGFRDLQGPHDLDGFGRAVQDADALLDGGIGDRLGDAGSAGLHVDLVPVQPDVEGRHPQHDRLLGHRDRRGREELHRPVGRDRRGLSGPHRLGMGAEDVREA